MGKKSRVGMSVDPLTLIEEELSNILEAAEKHEILHYVGGLSECSTGDNGIVFAFASVPDDLVGAVGDAVHDAINKVLVANGCEIINNEEKTEDLDMPIDLEYKNETIQ